VNSRTPEAVGRMSKRKGSKFQRVIAKELGIWWNNDPKSFHSTPSSGGLRWKTDVAKTAGDIVTSEDFPWVVECKNRESWHLEDLFKVPPNKSKVWEFWRQLTHDVSRLKEAGTNKARMLILKRNRLDELCMIAINDIPNITPNEASVPLFIKFHDPSEIYLIFPLEYISVVLEPIKSIIKSTK